MNAVGFLKLSIPTFSLSLLSNWYFDSNGSLTYKSIPSISGRSSFIILNHQYLKFYIDGQEYDTNLNYDLFQLIDHDFSSLL